MLRYALADVFVHKTAHFLPRNALRNCNVCNMRYGIDFPQMRNKVSAWLAERGPRSPERGKTNGEHE